VGADKVLQCRDCGNEFVFSAGEQEFYSTRGFSEPTRCPDCRAARKAQRDAGGSASGGYRETAGYGGGSYGGGRSSGGGYSRSGAATGTRQMYRVVCADCGQETEVPFEPRNGRPVYCRDCFERRQGRR
jgi:CxxC-x17-CxxC domain-containing protein